MEKHSDQKAFEEWLESKEGKECIAGQTQGEYLKNRIWYAFMAGRRSFEKEINPKH